LLLSASNRTPERLCTHKQTQLPTQSSPPVVNTLTDTFVSTTGFLQVVFKTDRNIDGAGFDAQWSLDSKPSGLLRMDDCMLCEVGKYSSRNASHMCTLCPADQYQDSVGQTTCLACPANSTTVGGLGNTSRAQCLCIAGFTGPEGMLRARRRVFHSIPYSSCSTHF
jgi:hypothetical protein